MVHRCLLIPELLRLICEALIDEPASLGSKSSLAALAATSRAFQGPALDYLWSNMADIVPLIKCMPRDLWKEKDDTSQRPFASVVLKFQRAIIPSDWKRFLVYCTRVQKLGFLPRQYRKRGKRIRIDPTVFEAITLATNARKLLPNLRELSWGSESGIFHYIHHFLSPKITRIRISLDICTGTRLSLIPTLANLYPEITHVDLQTLNASKGLDLSIVSDAVCQWNDLRVLKVIDLNDKALLHIASLPNLQELSFSPLFPFAHQPYDESHSSKHKIGFPSLRKLVMETPRIENCIGLIKLMSSCPLRDLELTVEDRSPVALWKTLFEAMEKHCLPTTLKSVDIEERCFQDLENPDEMDDYIMQFYHFKSLLHFPNVVHVIFEPCHLDSLTPGAVRRIATRWRGIQRLTLGTRTPSPGRPGITMDDLVLFAKYCPILNNLGIVFDALSVKQMLKKPGGGCSSVHLQKLHVGDSPISNSALVAAFLSDIFPSLSAIETIHGVSDDHFEGPESMWADAERMIAVFTSVRIQEQQHRDEVDSSDCSMDSTVEGSSDVSDIAD